MAHVNIVSRAQWGANPVGSPGSWIPAPVPELWLHHTGGEQHGAEGMRALQRFAMSRGYKDIEYTFVIDKEGTVFEARGPARDSAATYMHNTVSAAICVMGNYMNDQPSPQVLEAIAQLVAMGWQKKWWAFPAIKGGHKDASNNSTACPGDHLYAAIAGINHRAMQILNPPAPKPKPPAKPKVGPGHNPAWIFEPIVDDCAAPGGGAWCVAASGAVYGVGGAKYMGGANNKPYFAGRVAAQIKVRRYGPLRRKVGYTIVASSGETYNYPGV